MNATTGTDFCHRRLLPGMETDDATPAGTKLLLSARALAILFGAIIGATVLMQAGTGALTELGVATQSTLGKLASTVLQFAAFAIVVGLFLVGARDRDLLAASVPDRRDLALGVGSVVVLLAVQYGLLALLSAVGVLPVQNRAIDPASHAPAYFLAMVVLSVLVVGPAEELLFRGAVQGLLKRAWGTWPAIVGAALLFGFVHYNVGTGSLEERFAYVAIALLLGVMLGYLYEYSGNLVVPALAHGGYNAVAFGLQYLSAVGYVG